MPMNMLPEIDTEELPDLDLYDQLEQARQRLWAAKQIPSPLLIMRAEATVKMYEDLIRLEGE